jgi:hypothetical protein
LSEYCALGTAGGFRYQDGHSMHKALLISVLLATMWFPLRASKINNVRNAARETLIGFFAFAALYWLGLLWVYPALKN